MAGSVRQPVDLTSLEAYLQVHSPNIKTPLSLKQFAGGQSNPTYLITSTDGKHYVLRKQPPGLLVSKTAHRVDREARVLDALSNSSVPVPKVYCLCEDPGIIGTSFYIMSFLDGRIIDDPLMKDFGHNERRAMWLEAIRTLGRIHSADFEALGLGSFGKHTGFYNRQISTLTTIAVAQGKSLSRAGSLASIPHFDALLRAYRSPQSQPVDRTAIVHGDYRIGNLMWHKTEPRVIGILDWEMATIGNPLSDLASLVSPYSSTTDRVVLGTLPPLDELLSVYQKEAGWTLERNELQWGLSFHAFRDAVIMQGIAARLGSAQSSSDVASAKAHADKMVPYAERAWETLCKISSVDRSKL